MASIDGRGRAAEDARVCNMATPAQYPPPRAAWPACAIRPPKHYLTTCAVLPHRTFLVPYGHLVHCALWPPRAPVPAPARGWPASTVVAGLRKTRGVERVHLYAPTLARGTPHPRRGAGCLGAVAGHAAVERKTKGGRGRGRFRWQRLVCSAKARALSPHIRAAPGRADGLITAGLHTVPARTMLGTHARTLPSALMYACNACGAYVHS